MQRCLICDDHALVRDALASAIARRWPTAQIDVAENFPDGWQLAAALPDLMLVDLVMPGADGRDGIAGLQAAAPNALIIVVTGTHDDAMLLDLLRMGVSGVVPKTSGSDIILAAIDLALAGGRYLPDRVAELALHAPTELAARKRDLVTPRQKAVLRLIADGLSNKEIARALDVSPATVKTHVAQAIASVGAANRTDAAMRAAAQGII